MPTLMYSKKVYKDEDYFDLIQTNIYKLTKTEVELLMQKDGIKDPSLLVYKDEISSIDEEQTIYELLFDNIYAHLNLSSMDIYKILMFNRHEKDFDIKTEFDNI